QFCAWQRELGERIATDPDPDVAWAGAALAVREGCESTAPVAFAPPPPTNAGGRLMHYVYCERSDTCGDALAQWRAAEPDNLYLMVLALDAGDDVAPSEFARATRYADGWLDVRRIVATAAAHYDLAPPPRPAEYERRSLWLLTVDTPNDLLFDMQLSRGLFDALVDRDLADRALRRKLADILLAAEGTPFAGESGAQLGLDAATDAEDRRRYCTASRRAEASVAALWELTVEAPNSPAARQFADLLRDRNALDAIDAMAASLPLRVRPLAIDQKAIDDCVGDVPDEDDAQDDDAVEPIEAIADATID
ncbi:MAG TPA: hypothetical protein VJ724_07700, partial [Tahibacter sp.]|nr:hypothetical protein [Tahibacter sp.]